MGIQDRDYYRDGPSFLDRVGEQGATVWLIAITCGIFFGQYVPGSPLTETFVFDTERVSDGEVWRLFTSMFLHGGLFHLFFNMLFLYMAGPRLEEVYGTREFVLIYLFGGLFAGAFRYSVQVAGLAPPSLALGASGALAALLVIYAFRWPHQKVLFLMVIPMPIWLLAAGYVAVSAAGGFGDAPARGPVGGIGHLAHLGGAIFGFLYFQTGVEFSAVFRLFRRSKADRARPRLRVVPAPNEPESSAEAVAVTAPSAPAAPARASGPADEQMEAKLNAVLAKVSQSGMDSLTPEEREFLFRASEVLKQRRR